MFLAILQLLFRLLEVFFFAEQVLALLLQEILFFLLPAFLARWLIARFVGFAIEFLAPFEELVLGFEFGFFENMFRVFFSLADQLFRPHFGAVEIVAFAAAHPDITDRAAGSETHHQSGQANPEFVHEGHSSSWPARNLCVGEGKYLKPASERSELAGSPNPHGSLHSPWGLPFIIKNAETDVTGDIGLAWPARVGPRSDKTTRAKPMTGIA